MKKALIVIDLQKGFITRFTKNLPLKIQRFIQKRGKDYDLIIFTQYRNHPKSNFVKNLKYREFMREEEYGFVEELKGLTNSRNTFVKDTYGSFVKDRVLNELRKNRIKEVHLTGVDTENCVLTFARDAFDRGFRVVVLRSMCRSSSSPKLHKAALKIIKDNIGEVK